MVTGYSSSGLVKPNTNTREGYTPGTGRQRYTGKGTHWIQEDCSILYTRRAKNSHGKTGMRLYIPQSMPITSVRRSWPMQIVKGSLYVMIELLKMTDVS